MTVSTPSYRAAGAAGRMSRAATAFLDALEPDRRQRALLDLGDEVARRDWHYTPRARRGVSLQAIRELRWESCFIN